MNPSISIYLEIFRIFATLTVFVSHSSFLYLSFSDLHPHFGRNGVILFFVLSGYVISWCAQEKEPGLSNFTINRFARIYSVAIPGILLGVLVAIFSHWPDIVIPYPIKKLWIYLPIYLSFTGNFWTLSETPPVNFPFWSLNYEVWYYVIFGTWFYLSGKLRWLVSGLMMVLVGPSILSMFPLWIAGSTLYFFGHRLTIPRLAARLLVLVSGSLFIAAIYYRLDSVAYSYNSAFFRFLGLHAFPKYFLGDYLFGAIVIINLLGAMNAAFVFPSAVSSSVRTLASYSFSTYLFHIPIFSLIHSMFGTTVSFGSYLAEILTTILTIMFLARHTEHKKGWYRSLANRLISRLRMLLLKPEKIDGKI